MTAAGSLPASVNSPRVGLVGWGCGDRRGGARPDPVTCRRLPNQHCGNRELPASLSLMGKEKGKKGKGKMKTKDSTNPKFVIIISSYKL